MSQNAWAGRDSFQADTFINAVINNQVTEDWDETEPSPRRATAVVAVLFAATAVIICLVVIGITHVAEAPPAAGGPWPAGASRAKILAPVMTKLESCAAKTQVLKPLNCPQQGDRWAGSNPPATWTIEGDPSEGAIIFPHGDRLDVIGHAVMTATYHDLGHRLTFTVDLVPYRANVAWNNGTPTVTDLTRTKVKPKPPIKKQQHGAAWKDIAPILLNAFGNCAQPASSPLLARCPQADDPTPRADHATWTMEGDPSANAKLDFDPHWGLFHVTGDYLFTLHTKDPFGAPTTEPRSGHYMATLIINSYGIPQVLHINELKDR